MRRIFFESCFLFAGALLALPASAQYADVGPDNLPGIARQFGAAQSRLNAEQQDFALARAALGRARIQAQAAIRSSDEMDQARGALLQARDAYQDAQNAVDTRLADNKQYQQRQERITDLTNQIEQLRRTKPEFWEQRVLDLARAKLRIAQETTQTVGRVQNNTPGYEQARDRLITAAAKYRQLESAIPRKVDDAPAVVQAQEGFDKAQQQLQAAQIEFNGAAAAYDTAWDLQARQDYIIRRYAPGYGYRYWWR